MVFRDIDKKALIDNAATVVSKITIVGTDIVFTENDYISEWEYEDFRYVPENGFIGQFVERLFDGKLKDLPTDINIENKEISLQVGIVNGITGETTYYDYGNFIITKPGEEDTTGITSFESADYAKKFNATYTDNINYPCLALELANNACSQANVPLDVKGDAYCFAVKNEGLVAGEYSFLINGIYYNFSTTKDLKLYDSLLFILDENRIIQKNVNDDFTLTRTDIKPTSSSSMSGTLLKGSLVGYNDFINNDFVIENNQFEETDTLRDVMKAIAKLGYTWVRVGTDNKVHLDFKKKTTSTYGLTIEGKSVQDGTPTPDAPVEIESVEGVTSLFDKDSETKSLHYSTATGSENTSASSWSQFNFIEAKPNVSYTLSSTYLESNSSFEITQFDSSNNWIKSIQLSLTNGSYTFTTESTTKYIRIGARNDRGVELNIQLEEGSIVHDYVPYGRWLEQKTTGRNKFNKDGSILIGQVYNASGSIVSSSAWNIFSDFIEVENGSIYSASAKINSSVATQFMIIEFDKDKNFITRQNSSEVTNAPKLEATLSSTTKYIRFAYRNDTGMYDIQLEEGTVTSYEPYKENTALIDMDKKNLFDGIMEIGTIDGTNGLDRTSDVRLRSTNFINVEPSTQYTINTNSTNLKIYVFEYRKDGTFIQRIPSAWINSTYSFITNPATKYIRFIVSYIDESTITLDGSIVNNIKVYEGVEEYYKLASIGDIRDTFKDGILTQRIGKVVLDGSESWSYEPDYNRIYIVYNNAKAPTSVYLKANILSSHFEVESANLGYGSTTKNCIWLSQNKALSIRNTNLTSLNEYKTWLSNNPVEVYYELETPIEHTLDYEKLLLLDGVNNISFNDDIIDDSDYVLVEDNITIDDYYETEKQPNTYGPVNKVLLGMSQIDGENVYNAKLADEVESIEIEGKSVQETSVVKDGDNIFDFAKWYKNRNSIRQSATWDETSFSFDNTGTSEVITVTPPMNNNDLSSNKAFINIAGFEIESSTDYTFSCSNPNLVKTEILIFFYDKDYNYLSLLQGLGGSHSRLSTSFTTPSNAKYICFRFDNEARNVAPTNLKITEIALKKGADSTYTPFVSNSPSPDYPSEIKSVEGVTNLFNKNLFNKFTHELQYIFLTLEPNTQYIFSTTMKEVTNIGDNIFFINNGEDAGSSLNGVNINKSRTITTDSTGKVKIGYRDYNNLLTDEIENYEYQLEKGSVKHKHVPYGRWLEQRTAGKNRLNTPYTEDNKLTMTATRNDHYINSDYYADLEAGKTYTFSCKTSTTYGYSGITECYLLLNKEYTTIIHMDNNTGFTFTPKVSGRYYLRYDVNIAGETQSFWNFQIEEGSSATEFVLYNEDNTALIDLNKPNLFEKYLDNIEIGNSWNNSKNTKRATIVIPYEGNKPYTIKCSKMEGYRYVSIVETADRTSYYYTTNDTQPFSRTVVSNANTKYICLQLMTTNDFTIDMLDNLELKIYEGVEEYYRFASIEDVKDTFKDGVLSPKIAKITLNGTESYEYSPINGFNRFILSADIVVGRANSTALSTHFVGGRTDSKYNEIYLGGSGRIAILYNATSVDEFKTWLSENPVDVYYIISTPKQKSYNINYEKLKLHKGYNKITLNDDLEPNMNMIVSDIDNKLTTYSGNPILANLSDNIETSLQIWDNPLTYTENLRKIALNGSESLFGIRYTPMNINTVGHPWLEGDDYVKLTNLSEQTVYTYPFDRKLSYRGYIKSDISSTALTSVQQEYEFNGDINNRLSKTEISVDKANKEISLLSAEVEDTRENIATININTTNIEQQVTNLSTDLNNATTEIKESLSNYATENEVVQLRQEVATNQSSTALQINVINEALENGVSKVRTEKGFTFDDSGLTIDDNNSDIASNLDNEGLQIYDKTGSTESELLYAGIDKTTNEAVVRTKNLSVSQYFVMGSNSRFEDFEDEDGEEGTGVFFIG